MSTVSIPQRQRPLRRDKRTQAIRGKGEDAGKYFECWNCGFRCKVDRDRLGGAREVSGASFLDYTQTAIGAQENGVDVSVMPVLYQMNTTVVGLPIGSDGQPVMPHHRFVVSGTGCPLCHTKNWK